VLIHSGKLIPKLEKLAMVKCSSPLGIFVSDDEIRFDNIKTSFH
jgi:hypothetical protein